MKLYTYDPAPNPLRLSLMLRYKGIDITTEQVDMMKKEQMGDAFKSINSDMTLPTLVLDDGSIMTEVVGICYYLDKLYPEIPMFGENAQQCAEVISWDHQIFNSGLLAIAEVLRNSSPNFKNRALPGPLDVSQIPELAERGKIRIITFWNMLEKRLQSNDYLVANTLSFADISAAATVSFAAWIKSPIPEGNSGTEAWYKRMRAELNF